MRSILFFMVLGLGSAGCTYKYYVGPELPKVAPREVRISETRRPLNLEVACSFGDELLPHVGVIWSKAYREAVYADFREKRCGQFSTIVQEVFSQYASVLPAENVDRLAIKLEVRGQEALISRTKGRLTMEAELMPVGRPPLRHEYKASLHYGLGVPSGARPVEEVPWTEGKNLPLFLQRAEERVVRDMTLNLVRDLQQGGQL